MINGNELPIIRKPSVYAGKNEPTAVYDAALSNVCQSKNRELFRFWRVFPRFCPISQVFLRIQRAARTGSRPKRGRRFFCTLSSRGAFRASTSGLASRKRRTICSAKSFCNDADAGSFPSTPHCLHKSNSSPDDLLGNPWVGG